MDRPITVNAFHDDDADVWIATSDDLPGLVAEAASLDALRVKVLAMVDDLTGDDPRVPVVGRSVDLTTNLRRAAGW